MDLGHWLEELGNAIAAIDFWQLVERLGAIVAIFGLPYLVLKERRNISRFSYDFGASSGKSYVKGDKQYREFTFSGTIKNHSLNPNTISRIYMVVWSNRRQCATLRFGYGRYKITDEDKNQYKVPVIFAPREAKRLEIVYDSIITGTADEKILKEFTPVRPGSDLFLPKHTYELAFEDPDGNLFDQNGKLLSLKLINLNWTLENTFKQLKNGKYWPFIKHRTKIQVELIKLRWRRAVRALGLSF